MKDRDVSAQNGTGRPVGEDDLEQFVDGRLPPDRMEAVQHYLAGHPADQARVEADQALRAELRRRLASVGSEAIPSRLRIASLLARRTHERRKWLRAVGAGVALLALGLGTGWEARGWQAGRLPELRMQRVAEADDAIAAHRVFVVETAHPVEVAASQQAHLIQWLSRRVGHPLRALDLSARGYRLMGGRILPSDGEAAAQFMYEGAGGMSDRLTFYVRADARTDTAFRFADAEGYAAFSWVDAGLGFALVAKMDRSALLAVAETAYRQLALSGTSDIPSQGLVH